MLVKAILIFLLLMALLGMVGKWLFPGAIRRAVPGVGGQATAAS